MLDVDGSGGLDPMEAYCDMETDGGGWTLVGNYNHKGGTNPKTLVRSKSLPLYKTSELGFDGSLPINSDQCIKYNPSCEEQNENWSLANNTNKYWGHFSNSLADKMDFTEIRFFAISSSKSPKDNRYNNGRVVHFKINLESGIQAVKKGNTYFSGIEKPATEDRPGHTLLEGHTAKFPMSHNRVFFPGGLTDYTLIQHPMHTTSLLCFAASSMDGRWEVDDYLIGYAHHTYHQFWIR